MIRNIKIYFSFLMASIKTMLEYRVDCIVGAISQIAFQIIELIFIWIVFQSVDNIAGWKFEELLLLYGVMLLSISVTDLIFEGTYNIGRILIRKGKFDTVLLRPVHPLISILGNDQSTTALGYIAISVFLIIYMLIKLQINITFFLIFKILYFGILGGLIIGGVQTAFSVTGFWTYRSNEVVWSAFQVYRLAEYPIEIYNKFIKTLLTFIVPFAFVAYYPTLDYLYGNQGKMIYIIPIVTLVVWVIAVKVWNWGLKKYRSTGT